MAAASRNVHDMLEHVQDAMLDQRAQAHGKDNAMLSAAADETELGQRGCRIHGALDVSKVEAGCER